MNYLERLAEAWKLTYQVAMMKMATEMQIDALADLRESEFGYGSNARLRDMWRTFVDVDGNVVMVFEVLTPTDYVPLVTISIDQDGVLTIKDDETGDTEVCDPMKDGWSDDAGNYHPMWYLPERFLKKLSIPSIKYIRTQVPPLMYETWVAEVVDLDKRFYPVFMWNEVTHCWSTNYWDGPLAGFVRQDGKLLYYSNIYEDDISKERLFKLSDLSGFDAFKVHTNRVIWAIELKWNKLVYWPKKSWRRLPRFDLKHFADNPLYAYLSSEKAQVTLS
jgi:hypothetical protein